MRTQLALALLLLLTVAAVAPLASALCVPRHEKKSEGKKHDSEEAAEAPSASEKTSESKRHKSSEDDDDDAAPSAAEKKSESKKRASEDDAAAPGGAEKKSKSKSDASEDDHDEKKSENKSHASEDDEDAEKKTKSKNDASEDDDGAEKKSKSKSQASEDDDGAEKKSKSNSHASKDAAAAPSAAETTGNESVLSKKVDSEAKEDEPDGEAAPKKPAVNVQSMSDMITKPVLGVLSPVVKTLCTKTDYPDLCESSIAKLPEAPPAQLDGLGMLKLAMNAVRAKIVEAKNAAVDKMTDPGTDKLSKAAINDCLELYDDMNTNFDTAEDALKRGDKGTAGTMLDSALTDVDTCENGFLDRDGLKPLMADDDKILQQLSSNVLAINAAVD